MTDPADLSAADLLDAYRARKLSPVEVLDAVHARVARCEPKLNALYAPDPETARAAARESEKRWLDGTARGLEGVPVTIVSSDKDLMQLVRPGVRMMDPIKQIFNRISV